MNAKVERGTLSRALVLQNNHQRIGGILADPPAVTITAQTLLPDLRIPVADARSPLEYSIPQPSEPEDPDDLIEFRIRRKDEPSWEDIEPFLDLGPVANRVWPLIRTIPVSFLVETATPEDPTEYEVQYIYWYGATNEGTSELTTFAIDFTPPYKVKTPAADRSPGAPSFPADIGPGVPIDETVIDRHPAGILIRAASYSAWLDTDYIRVYWGLAPDIDRDLPAFEGPLPSNFSVTIPIDKFSGSEEGVNTMVYTVTDLATNRSKRSNPARRTVKFLGDPTTILPPLVPLASGVGGDDRIDLADCRVGVQIEITVPTSNAPGDTIIAFWGTEELSEERVGINTALVWDVEFDVIKKVYGVTDGDVVTNISYKMFRGARKIAESDININVDISYPGPINPGEPDPVNILLDAPRLESANGNVDQILDEDYGEDATIFIDLYDAPATEEGILIDVYYDNERIDTLELTNGQEGTTLQTTLPWATILGHSNGTKILHWVLYTLTGPNSMGSPPKDIDVQANLIETPMPLVLGLAGPLRRIGCPTLNFGGDGTLRRNLMVNVPKSAYTVDGETITLKWAAYTADSPPVLIPGTEVTVDHVISGVYPDDGVDIEIGDYNTHFRPANRADGKLTYTITLSGGGVTPDSLPAVHRVLLTNSEGQYCEEANP